MFDDLSHQIELTVVILSAFFAFITESFWREWAIVSFLSLFCLIIDYLFFAKDAFIYDPDYLHWKDLNEPKDFEFKNE